MKVFVIVGRNNKLGNVSARAVYSTYELAQNHLDDKERMWFDDEAVVVELILDKEVPVVDTPVINAA